VLNGFYLSAQKLHIAQDINHCSFGLKNDSGRWVVKPSYAQIESVIKGKYGILSERGWVISYDGFHYGLIDTAGQLIFPPIYKSVTYGLSIPEKNIFAPQPKYEVGADSSLIIMQAPEIIKMDDLYFFSFKSYSDDIGIGFADSAGNVLTHKLYRNIYSFTDGHACFWNKDNLLGYLDKKGNEIIPAHYTERQISPPTKYGVYVCNDSITGFIRWSDCKFFPMKMVYAFEYRLSSYAYTGTIHPDSFFKGKQGNKYGLLGSDGKIIAPAIYDSIGEPVNGMLFVRKNGKFGFINTAGKILLQANCDALENFDYDYNSITKKYIIKNNSLLFERKGKCGIFCDTAGIILKPIYSAGAWYDADRKLFWGLQGKQVHAFKIENSVAKEIPFEKMIATNYYDSIIILPGSSQTFQVDRKGKLIGKPLPWMQVEEDPYSSIPENFHTIKSKNGYGLINEDSNNRVIVPPIYKAAGTYGKFLISGHGWETFDDGFIYVETYGGHYGVYSTDGKFIVDTIYTSINMNSSDDDCWIAQTKKDGDWHLINSEGKVMAVSEKEIIRDRGFGKYIITRKGHKDLFDLYSEKYVVENKYAAIFPLAESEFIVMDDEGNKGLMDITGQLIVPCRYSNITSPALGIILLFSDSGEAIADLSGNIISPFSKMPFAARPISFDTVLHLRDYVTAQNQEDYSEGNYSIVFADTALEFASSRIANNFLLDSLCGISSQSVYDDDYFSTSWQMITAGQENVYWENDWDSGLSYSISSLTPVSFSVAMYSFEAGHGGYYDEYAVNNFIIRNDSVIKIGLYDILRSDLSYQAINDTIRNTIVAQAENEFFFDCSNPAMLSPDYFTITADGISVWYLNKNAEAMDEMDGEEIFSRMENVILPWSLIGKYLKPGTELQKIYGK